MEFFTVVIDSLGKAAALGLFACVAMLLIVITLDSFGVFDSDYGKSFTVFIDKVSKKKKWIQVTLRDIELVSDEWKYPRRVTEAVVKIPRSVYEDKMKMNPFAIVQCKKGLMYESFTFIGPAPRV